MADKLSLTHHVCPYLCCHLAHAVGECPFEVCENQSCDGRECWWFDKRQNPPPGVSHFGPNWAEVHRDGSVPTPYSVRRILERT